MQRQVVIGDIHGCFEELMALLEAVDLQPEDLLISVGDLVDRGPDSIRVVRFFRERPNSIVLMGNHERKHTNEILTYAQEIVRLQLGDAYDEVVAWMKTLPYFLETESAIIVHAGLEPGVELSRQREDVLCGSTSGEKYLAKQYGDRYWHELYDGTKPVIFGHHVVGDDPFVHENRIFGIDTGACHGGRLTALILPTFELKQVPAARDWWALEKRRWQVPVLRHKPWSSLTFEKLHAEIERFGGSRDEAVRDYVAGIERWVRELEGLTVRFLEVLASEVDRLRAEHGQEGFRKAAAQHPASGWVFQQAAGVLTAEKLREQLETPDKVRSFAAKLGIEAPAPGPL